MQLLGKVLGLKGLKLLEPPVCTSFKEKQWSTWFYPIQTDVSYQHAGWNSIYDLLVVAPAWLHPQAILAAATLAGNVKALHWKGLTESSKKWRKIVWFLTIQGLFTSQPKTAEILSFPSSVYIPSKRRLMEKNALLSLPFINSTSLTCSWPTTETQLYPGQSKANYPRKAISKGLPFRGKENSSLTCNKLKIRWTCGGRA